MVENVFGEWLVIYLFIYFNFTQVKHTIPWLSKDSMTHRKTAAVCSVCVNGEVCVFNFMDTCELGSLLLWADRKATAIKYSGHSR